MKRKGRTNFSKEREQKISPDAKWILAKRADMKNKRKYSEKRLRTVQNQLSYNWKKQKIKGTETEPNYK